MRRSSPHRATLIVAGLFMVGLAAGSLAGRAMVARATTPYAGLDRFARMMTAIEADYVEPLDGDRLVDAALEGMVDELDPHSRWMSARAVRDLEDDAAGRTTGFGIEVGRGQEGVVVLKVLPGSPAERQGLRRGDRILSIDDRSLSRASMQEVANLFEGPTGEQSELEILRPGWEESQTVAAARESVHLPATEGFLLDGDVMYIRLIDFQHGSSAELDADMLELQDAADRPWAGLVLDLRDNTGGLLVEAVRVADLFLDEGTIVSVRGRRDGERAHEATPGGVPGSMPVAVLINGLSASASEIVAGALQDTRRGILVGTPSYGKGSVQQLYRNGDGSALKLTVARYHRPSGESIEARQGLLPDIHVEASATSGPRAQLLERVAQLDLGEDERRDLLGLLADLEEREPRSPRIPWSVPVAERLPDDPVVQAALRALTDPVARDR